MAEQKKNSGCVKAAIVVGVLVLVGVVAMVALPAMWFKTVKGEQRLEELRLMEAHEARAERTVTYDQGEIAKIPPHRPGEEVKREQFVALMVDELATDLARKEFQRTADGATVRWLLETRDVVDDNGALRGQFVLPYEIVVGNSTRGSAVSLHCEFVEESKEALLRVRRGDWVLVEGQLAFDGQNAEIKEARVVDDKAPVRP